MTDDRKRLLKSPSFTSDKGNRVLPEFFEFHNPTRVVYGVGLASDFKAEVDALGIRRYFIDT